MSDVLKIYILQTKVINYLTPNTKFGTKAKDEIKETKSSPAMTTYLAIALNNVAHYRKGLRGQK